MKNVLLVVLLFVFLLGCSAPPKIEPPETYSEAPDPSADTLTDWSTVKPGLHASIGSIDVRYNKSLIPDLKPENTWEGFAWRNEILSAQLVLWNSEPSGIVSCEFSEFKSEDGSSMQASIAQARFVRYVLTDEFGPGCGYRKPEDFIARLSADVLDTLSAFEMEANSTRPVWLSFDIPMDAKPGIYTSTLQLKLNGKKHSAYKLQIEVADCILPNAADWKFHLDLWQNPYTVARVHDVELWSAEHWEVLRPLMKLLADAGQKVITTTLNNRPWGGQTEDAFGSMIEWNKQADGSWTYDYSVFDKWVEFVMEVGINQQINCYSMVPWGNEFYYFDVASGEEVKIKADPGSKEYEALWTPFLTDFVKHLDEKGWKAITRIAMDERGPEAMKATIGLIEKVAPEMGVALADNHQSYNQFPDRLIDLCVARNAEIEPEVLKYRKEKGYVSTWYVCCGDAFPNVFTFSNPAEAVYIGWHTMAADLDGFLRWAYNSWVKNPLTDSRFRTWPAGDTYIVYPDARSSIRFERLREGIQDAEKIRLLKAELTDNSSDEANAKLNRLDELLERCKAKNRPDDFDVLMKEGKQLLEDLSK
ncbi:glycoside hydrolase domain-containing protein [Maribellus sp. YY47]|uniref:DUF4091 domain-containing protein n=1 Tax=Maribellus sp. YY47 TaxID=2929486 RepID=UPI0020010751|nr:glycoside hydrolase domain-containing protein [Maribellus sp. YY47]MCK3685591.1 DUF4091 domain-containing protein [Maribellus sp. YY47]